ncbi:Manganese transporter SMF2 [Sphaceloma murrayae]|uniref:Manganese transporter SMF2 n=1 Tax=Sphaceloma murrayae TaxID=2082308 RepID=A0A2K1QFD6_9PEZI|nr:Manganese transporter SMF2 [Sphaceloma murrayae]
MNKVSRTDEPYEGDGYNQSPDRFSSDLITNSDLNGISNSRTRRDQDRIPYNSDKPDVGDTTTILDPDGSGNDAMLDHLAGSNNLTRRSSKANTVRLPSARSSRRPSIVPPRKLSPVARTLKTLRTFGRFIGPGFLVAVAYIDPGNYATAIEAGSSYRFRLLFVILMSNLFAIMLQSLAIKLGSVTGLNLAEACRAFLPRWLNYFLYGMAEAAIIATDIAEVIGTAIALNLLSPKIPLVAGCALSILDVMLILLFYRPDGSMKALRGFEFFVAALVLGVVVCFCIQLSLIEGVTPGEVFKGYIPNSAVTQSQGLYQACGILGATVMPHSLYLGSGMVQSRLRDYDKKEGLLPDPPQEDTSEQKNYDKVFYIPSLRAIKHSLKYSYAELAISLFTFALFVNSAILIVAGASLYNNDRALDADIFAIHDLLASSISRNAGTLFALALLFSGISAGIICTISGQMVSEGALKWRMKPWLRRLVTRSISITPSIIIAGAAGREKLNDALTGSQVALSVVLPFVSAPLIWFTCFDKYMTVHSGRARYHVEGKTSIDSRPDTLEEREEGGGDDDDDVMRTSTQVKMANDWWVAALAVAIWLVIVIMNVANLVLLGLGRA